MRIRSMEVHDVPPVKLFSVETLSDVVVIAGPNGVGKSRLIQALLAYIGNMGAQPGFRLIIEATSPGETVKWGKDTLDTAEQTDAAALKATLQENRNRGNWKSSVLLFESDRSIQQIKPYAFTWEAADPYTEKVGWNTTFGGMKNRFQDTVHSIFRIIAHQKQSIANQAIRLRKEGKERMNLSFADPIEPFRRAFSQLLAPKELCDPQPSKQKLV